MATLAVPHAVLNYEIWEQPGTVQGDWVTLVNGHTRPLNDFRMLGKKLVEQGFRVLALDNRGAGQTTVEEPFTLADMCNDIRALWHEHGIRVTHLLGISMGGFISETLALESPEMIDRLLLVSTAARHAVIQGEERPWSANIEETAAKLSYYFTPAFAERNAMLVKSMAKQIASQVESGAFVENSKLQRRALSGFDISERLFAVAAPTLVIHGTDDQILPIGEGRLLAESIPNARIEELPGMGHLLLAEAPAKLYELVISFLRN